MTKQASFEAILYTDGASLGNPGPAGAGFVLETPSGQTIVQRAIPLGRTTVGVAEYRALIAGLSEALSRDLHRVRAVTDSEFMCRQLQGKYKVRTAAIKPLYEWAQKLIGHLQDFEIHHTRREHNSRADALAKQGAQQAQQQLATQS